MPCWANLLFWMSSFWIYHHVMNARSFILPLRFLFRPVYLGIYGLFTLPDPDSDTDSDLGCRTKWTTSIVICRTVHTAGVWFKISLWLLITGTVLKSGSESESAPVNVTKPLYTLDVWFCVCDYAIKSWMKYYSASESKRNQNANTLVWIGTRVAFW